MLAMVLKEPRPIETNPLSKEDLSLPEISKGEILIEVKACGICRTDLHIIEGEIPTRKLPLVPGHQIVGVVKEVGYSVTKLKEGDRVGVTWLYSTCGKCHFCKRGLENLCESAQFTGYSVDGGYAEYVKSLEGFTFKLPSNYEDFEVAPLLCAGVIGFRALRMCELKEGEKLGLYGFGSSAHLVLQIANHLGFPVYVFTRSREHQELAVKLGAQWVGKPTDDPGVKLNASIVFAPAGWVALEALKRLDKAGRLVLAGIYMTPMPSIDYSLLYHERVIRSVANCTRKDIVGLLSLAERVRLKVSVQKFKLEEANEALRTLKTKGLRGSGVLIVK